MIPFIITLYVCLTIHPSDQQIAMSPLMNPVLEGATFLLHLRNSSCNQLSFRIHHTILEEGTLEIRLHCGIRHRVCWPVHQILRNHSVGNTRK